jgi:hypothetical protein
MKRKSRGVARKRATRSQSVISDLSVLDDKKFLIYARQLASAAKRRTADQSLPRSEPGFASQLLFLALNPSDHQIASSKLLAQFWAQEKFQKQFRKAKAKSPLPPPENFLTAALSSIARPVLALYKRDALRWCINTYLVNPEAPVKELAQAIAACGFTVLLPVFWTLFQRPTQLKPLAVAEGWKR